MDGLPPGTLVVAERVVDETGETLWEREPLDVPGARAVTVCTARAVVDDPEERAELAARTAAQVVDLESARLAATGRLTGVVRAVLDTPGSELGVLAHAARPDGGVTWRLLGRAVIEEPARTTAAARHARRGLAALRQARV